MAAAIEAARAGLPVHVYDENPEPGGQIYRQAGSIRARGSRFPERETRGTRLLEAFRGAGVTLHADAVVWAVFDERTLAVWEHGTSETVRADVLVLAVGAYDRPVAIPGWTLPGVYTAGAAQVLVRTQGVLPGRRVLVAGTGPLLAVVGAELAGAGAHVVAVLEAASLRGAWTVLPQLVRHRALVGDAWRAWRGVRAAGIPFRRARTVTRILGDWEVEGAVTASLDGDWRPVAGTEETLAVDTVCLGFGFVPQTELARLAGCELSHVPEWGGWVPVTSPDMETSVPGVFAAGDGAGVAGAAVAALEGRIAGIAAAARLGALSATDAAARARPHRRALAGLRKLHVTLDRLTRVRDGLGHLTTPETVVCRCEDVTAGAVDEALEEGATELAEIKRATRAGMGLCQGRMCEPALAGLVARRTGRPAGAVEPFGVRPPVKPVPIEALASLAEPEP
jgi:NADPH-dependent 2,4-dienoyl-CoA reductase/sulfur reductase-like enzyme